MTLRLLGTLARWNDERGFGFITPQSGGDDVFVHISAFPRGQKPIVGEHLSFETDTGADGRTRAIRVILPNRLQLIPAASHRPAAAPEPAPSRAAYSPRPTRSRHQPRPFPLGRALMLVFVAIAGAIGFGEYRKNIKQTHPSAAMVHPTTSSVIVQTPMFQCDGRTHCSQMRSCEEAKFFLRNCPGSQMDGDHDGRPCERGPC